MKAYFIEDRARQLLMRLLIAISLGFLSSAPSWANDVSPKSWTYSDNSSKTIFTSAEEACHSSRQDLTVVRAEIFDNHSYIHCIYKTTDGAEVDYPGMVVANAVCPENASSNRNRCSCDDNFEASGGRCVATADARTSPGDATTAQGKASEPIPQKKKLGEWTNDATAGTNMNSDQAAYQKQITGKPADKTYYVNKRSFDGCEPAKGGSPIKLIEAKHLGDEGRFAKAYENMKRGNYSDLVNLMDRAEKILDQAKGQVKAAAETGAEIEWRVSGKSATEALQALFDHEPLLKGKITVVHVPFAPKGSARAPEQCS